MIRFPNAKVNVGLNVVERRTDGYHNLETMFYPIPLCDALEVTEAKRTSLRVEGIDIEGDVMDNLVMKAYKLLDEEFHLPPVEVTLVKRIPTGAGLGGGSADAAEMLKALNELFELEFSDDRLEGYATRLGADCAFFIKNRPMFAEGIGNVFSEVDVQLKGYYMLLEKPKIHVSTKEAYGGVIPQHPLVSLKEVLKRPIDEWKEGVKNDFERSVFVAHPQIAEIKERMYDSGAVYASMSGSGSAVYGLFNERPTALDVEGAFCEVLAL